MLICLQVKIDQLDVEFVKLCYYFLFLTLCLFFYSWEDHAGIFEVIDSALLVAYYFESGCCQLTHELSWFVIEFSIMALLNLESPIQNFSRLLILTNALMSKCKENVLVSDFVTQLRHHRRLILQASLMHKYCFFIVSHLSSNESNVHADLCNNEHINALFILLSYLFIF